MGILCNLEDVLQAEEIEKLCYLAWQSEGICAELFSPKRTGQATVRNCSWTPADPHLPSSGPFPRVPWRDGQPRFIE